MNCCYIHKDLPDHLFEKISFVHAHDPIATNVDQINTASCLPAAEGVFDVTRAEYYCEANCIYAFMDHVMLESCINKRLLPVPVEDFNSEWHLVTYKTSFRYGDQFFEKNYPIQTHYSVQDMAALAALTDVQEGDHATVFVADQHGSRAVFRRSRGAWHMVQRMNRWS